MRKNAVSWAMILLGGLIYSVGLNAFLVGNHLAEGGITGIAVVLLYMFGIPIGPSILVLNIPLLILGWRMFGVKFIVKTTVGVVSVSVFASLTSGVKVYTHDPLLAALYAGVVTGFGLGLIFRTGATTGGVDIIARAFRHYKGIGMGKTLFAGDVIVITLVAIVVGYQTAMYSLVALFVSSRVIDFVIEGATRGKALIIISDRHDEIADAIHSQLDRGTTMLKAKGGYTGEDKSVVYCVVAREEVTRVQQIVASLDERAFVIVNDVHEVLGEGFTYDSPAALPLANKI
jgi:uncharacterized membrane-anchored protein YitT (DUF2179 family)